MIVAKQVADLITFGRLGIAIILVFLGIRHGQDALPLVIWLMLADWFGDFLDGNLARRSRRKYKTWIGEHDLQVDMSVATGLLLYLIAAQILPAGSKTNTIPPSLGAISMLPKALPALAC